MVVGNTSYFAFARYALVAGLRHLQVEAGDEVAVPELICRDVLSSINSVGAVPRFLPRRLGSSSDFGGKHSVSSIRYGSKLLWFSTGSQEFSILVA